MFSTLEFLLSFLLILQAEIAQNRQVMKMTNLVCEVTDSDFVHFELCEMRALARNKTELNIRAHLHRLPVTNVTFSLAIKKRGFLSGKALREFNVDACLFLSNKRRNPLADWFYKLLDFERHSNMNHSCPYNHDLIFEKLNVGESILGFIPFPEGQYTLLTVWSAYGKARSKVHFNFELLEK